MLWYMHTLSGCFDYPLSPIHINGGEKPKKKKIKQKL